MTRSAAAGRNRRGRRLDLERLEGRALLSGTGTFTNAFAVSINDQGWQEGAAVDSSGNTYVTGCISGYSDFDPGPGTTMITNHGNRTAYVAKYSPSGSLLWAEPIGGTNTDSRGDSIAVDGSGNVYLSGFFSGTVNFNPAGSYTLTYGSGSIYSGYAGFVEKLNSSGGFVWVQPITPTGSSGSAEASALAVDSAGNVFVSGNSSGGNVGTGGPAVAAGVFVARMTSSGGTTWAESYGNAAGATVSTIALDGSDNVYSTGYFYYTGNFNPSGTTTLTNGGGQDIYVTKLTGAGALSWAGRIGGAGDDFPSGIVADASGNVFVSGTFSGTADLDPSAGVHNVTATPSHFDTFAERLTTSGTLTWADAIGGTSDVDAGLRYHYGDAVAIDSSDNVYIGGSYSGTADFDPGAGTYNLAASGSGSVFVERLNADSSFGWATVTSGGGGAANNVGVDSSRNVTIVGQFGVTPPTFGTITPSSFGSTSLFVAKLVQSQPYTPSVVVGSTPAGPAALPILMPAPTDTDWGLAAAGKKKPA